MGAILGQEWGGAYMDNVKILDINGEWKLRSGSTTVLPIWNMLYKITGKSGQFIFWGEIAPRDPGATAGTAYDGTNILDLSFLGNVDSFGVEIGDGQNWLTAFNQGNMLVCGSDALSQYGSQTPFQSLVSHSYQGIEGFSLK